MTLKERFLAKETKIGRLLKSWVAYLLLLCAAVGTCIDYIAVLPPGWDVPQELKLGILVAALISKVAGHLTVDKTKLKDHD